MPRRNLKEGLMRKRWAPPVVLATVLIACQAHAIQQVKSLYTVIDLDKCKSLASHPQGNEWICDGLPAYPVYIAEGDLRFYLSAGPKEEQYRYCNLMISSF
jgi:hypothetical protein